MRHRHQPAAAVAAAALALAAAPASGQFDHFLIPIDGYAPGSSGAIDFVYDDARRTLFISTSQGAVDRFHVPSMQLLPRWEIGVFTPAIELTPDGGELLLAERTLHAGQGRLHRIDPETGVVTPLVLPGGDGSWDVVATADRRAFVTPEREGVSGASVLREINLDTGAVRTRGDVPFSFGQTRYQSRLFASPDRSRFFLHEGNTSSPEATIFDAGADRFIGSSIDYFYASFNHDASLAAAAYRAGAGEQLLRVIDADFRLVAQYQLGNILASAFDPVRDHLYLAVRETDEIVTVSTIDWSILDRQEYPYDFDSALRMTMSADGALAFLQTREGVVMFTVPAPGAVGIAGFLCIAAARRRRKGGPQRSWPPEGRRSVVLNG